MEKHSSEEAIYRVSTEVENWLGDIGRNELHPYIHLIYVFACNRQ